MRSCILLGGHVTARQSSGVKREAAGKRGCIQVPASVGPRAAAFLEFSSILHLIDMQQWWAHYCQDLELHAQLHVPLARM
jgi:hypothetical protein